MDMSKPWQNEETLRELYHGEGLTQPQIAEALGCSARIVSKWMDRHDIEVTCADSISRSKLGPAYDILSDREQMEQLYWRERKSLAEIADEIGVSPNTVKSWLQKHGLGNRTNAEATRKGEHSPHWTGGVDYYGPNWTQKKQERLEIDGNACVVCGLSDEELKLRGDKDGVHVHHIQKIRRFKQDDGSVNYERANRVENLITLCRDCHNRWEGIPLRPEV
jgi:5-methylcytosine-specific restriction endonuclease McrA